MRTRRRSTRRTRRPRTYKRKALRRARRSNKTTIRNSRPATVISDRFITKMKYADRYQTGFAGQGLTGVYVFNLNSTFDPDRTGTGHQPWGRDQLAQLYHRYRVFAVSWRVTFYPIPGTSNPAALFVVPLNHADPLTGQVISVVRETPRAMVKLSSTDKPTVFTGRISLARLLGQTSAEYKGSDRYQALNTGDPSELMTLQVGSNFTSAGGQASFEAQLTYHVEWFDPLPVGQS